MPPRPASHADPLRADAAAPACGDRSVEDFGGLYARTFHGIRAWIARQPMAADSAEDLTQETFLQAMQISKRYRGEGSPESWLFGIARNVVRHHRRRTNTRKRGGDVAILSFDEQLGGVEGSNPFDDLHARWDYDAIAAQARCAVSEAEWQLLTAHHVDDTPLEELADRASCSRTALKSRLHRARGKLAPALAGLHS